MAYVRSRFFVKRHRNQPAIWRRAHITFGKQNGAVFFFFFSPLCVYVAFRPNMGYELILNANYRNRVNAFTERSSVPLFFHYYP